MSKIKFPKMIKGRVLESILMIPQDLLTRLITEKIWGLNFSRSSIMMSKNLGCLTHSISAFPIFIEQIVALVLFEKTMNAVLLILCD